MNSPWFLLYAPFMVLGTLTFVTSLVADGFGPEFDLAEHRKLVESWRPYRYPTVDVFLPTCGEPVELLRNSWTHVAAMRAAYPGRLTPLVLDDSGRARAQGAGQAVRVRVRGPARPRLVQEVGQPQVRARHLRRRVHPAARRRLRAARPTCWPRRCPTSTRSPTSGSCRPRSTATWSTSRPGSSAVRAPSRSCSTGRSRRCGRARTARSASAAARCTADPRSTRTAACRSPSTPRTCTPASTCTGWAGGCATCRSRCPQGTARTTSWRS